jgi:hypothetical protein
MLLRNIFLSNSNNVCDGNYKKIKSKKIKKKRDKNRKFHDVLPLERKEDIQNFDIFMFFQYYMIYHYKSSNFKSVLSIVRKNIRISKNNIF